MSYPKSVFSPSLPTIDIFCLLEGYSSCHSLLIYIPIMISNIHLYRICVYITCVRGWFQVPLGGRMSLCLCMSSSPSDLVLDFALVDTLTHRVTSIWYIHVQIVCVHKHIISCKLCVQIMCTHMHIICKLIYMPFSKNVLNQLVNIYVCVCVCVCVCVYMRVV